MEKASNWASNYISCKTTWSCQSELATPKTNWPVLPAVFYWVFLSAVSLSAFFHFLLFVAHLTSRVEKKRKTFNEKEKLDHKLWLHKRKTLAVHNPINLSVFAHSQLQCLWAFKTIYSSRFKNDIKGKWRKNMIFQTKALLNKWPKLNCVSVGLLLMVTYYCLSVFVGAGCGHLNIRSCPLVFMWSCGIPLILAMIIDRSISRGSKIELINFILLN